MQQQDRELQAKPQRFKHLKFCFSILGSKEVASEVLATGRRQKADGVSIEKIDCEAVTPLKALVIQAWQVGVKGDGKRQEVTS